MARSKSVVESIDLSNHLCCDYLLNLENTEETRSACVKYLRNFINKTQYADLEIISRNKKRILELGGDIGFPVESKKLAIFKFIFGTKYSIMMKEWFWNLEITIRRKWDKFLYILLEGDAKF